MRTVRSERLKALPPYLFVEIDKKRRARIAAGAEVINLGVGDPARPTPPFIIEAMNMALRNQGQHQYPRRRFFEETGISNLPVLAEDGENLLAITGKSHLPLTLIADKEGRWTGMVEGEASWDDAETLRWITRLAAG